MGNEEQNIFQKELNMFHSRTFRSIVILIVALVFASTAFAMANSNSFETDPTMAGDGSTGISGYYVSAIHYNLYSSDPSLIESVQFTLDAAATDVRAGIDGTYATSCSNGGSGNDWTCDFDTTSNTVPVSSAANLQVIAAQ